MPLLPDRPHLHARTAVGAASAFGRGRNLLPQLPRGRIGALGAAAGDEDAVALAQELAGQGLAQPLGAAGDDDVEGRARPDPHAARAETVEARKEAADGRARQDGQRRMDACAFETGGGAGGEGPGGGGAGARDWAGGRRRR